MIKVHMIIFQFKHCTIIRHIRINYVRTIGISIQALYDYKQISNSIIRFKN